MDAQFFVDRGGLKNSGLTTSHADETASGINERRPIHFLLQIDPDAAPILEGTVDVATTYELMPDVPAGKTVVAESGISERAELEELERVGVDAVLIGEALMRADDPAAKVRELTADEDSTREHFL